MGWGVLVAWSASSTVFAVVRVLREEWGWGCALVIALVLHLSCLLLLPRPAPGEGRRPWTVALVGTGLVAFGTCIGVLAGWGTVTGYLVGGGVSTLVVPWAWVARG